MNPNEKQVKDFLISKTNPQGKITYCNEAFIDISGFTESELLGKPHSIVRHADMPRTFFKFLWSEITQKKEINGYVKNLSKDGKYYWVFANITPSLDIKRNIIGYYSVRRAPNPKAIPILEDLYAKLREAEKSGLDSGLEYFKRFFATKDYNSFVLDLQVRS